MFRLPSIIISLLLSTGLVTGLQADTIQWLERHQEQLHISAELMNQLQAQADLGSDTGTPSASPSPSPSPSVSPSPTPSPTVEPTASPSATPSPSPEPEDDDDDDDGYSFKNFGRFISYFRNKGQRSHDVHQYQEERRQERDDDDHDRGIKVGHAEELKLKTNLKIHADD